MPWEEVVDKFNVSETQQLTCITYGLQCIK
uniref:Uncharacterized protein n=1 Tax=Lepeophtheirus salmonis TaxID=72036 RepID=A0A0K2UIL3_LEPSM